MKRDEIVPTRIVMLLVEDIEEDDERELNFSVGARRLLKTLNPETCMEMGWRLAQVERSGHVKQKKTEAAQKEEAKNSKEHP